MDWTLFWTAIGVIAVVALPLLAASVGVYVQLSVLKSMVVDIKEDIHESKESKRELWSKVNNHEGRLATHDKFIGHVVNKLKIPNPE